MSYNLLYGAGADRAWDPALPIEFAGRNRLPDFLSVVKNVDPDILGIEEANSWDKGAPALIQQVAQDLGMNSYLARTPSGFHIGILTKFAIAETENLSSEIGKQGALRATLVAPDREPLNVFVAHLEPNSPDIRMCEVNALLRLMQPHLQRRTILIGDMNFRPTSPEYARLMEAGWKPVAIEANWRIDQIWIYPSHVWDTTRRFETLLVPPSISDHNPIAAEINLYSAVSNPARIAPVVLTPQVPITVPLFVTDSLTGTLALRRENLHDACAISKWKSRWSTEKISSGRLEIEGEERWQAFVARYKEFTPGQGILARFQFVPGSEFEMYFDNGNWAGDAYRRYGINLRDRALQSITWQGLTQQRGENFAGDSRLSTSLWYYLWLATSKRGEVMVQVWDPSDPSRSLRIRQRLPEELGGQSWMFQIAANRGRVWIDEVTEISFDDFK